MSLDERTGSEETLHEPYEFDDPEIDETENGNFYCETCGRSVPLGMRHGPQSCTGGMIDFPEELDPADAQRVHDETLQAWSTARLEVKRTIEEITRIRDDVKVADELNIARFDAEQSRLPVLQRRLDELKTDCDLKRRVYLSAACDYGRPRRELLFRKLLYGSRLIKIENRQFSVGLRLWRRHRI